MSLKNMNDRSERRLNKNKCKQTRAKQFIALWCMSFALSQSRVKHLEETSQETWPAYVVCFPFNLAVSHSHLSDRCLGVHKCVCVCVLVLHQGLLSHCTTVLGEELSHWHLCSCFAFLTASLPHTIADTLKRRRHNTPKLTLAIKKEAFQKFWALLCGFTH